MIEFLKVTFLTFILIMFISWIINGIKEAHEKIEDIGEEIEDDQNNN